MNPRHSRLVRTFAALLFASLITACTTPRPAPPQRSDLPSSYTVNGRIAVQAQGRGYSAQFSWMHQDQQDTIDLSNPLGQVVARLLLTPQLARFVDDEGKVHTADDIESLTAARLGWRLPVAGMRYWLLGLADQTQPGHWTHRDDGSTLDQGGWQIAFDKISGKAPDRITLRRPDLEVRIALYDWQFD